MQTLSYGYEKPEAGDNAASGFFTGMEDNIQRLNDHNHDGTNSALLPAQNISATTQSIASGSWSAFGPTGHYRQLITTPAGFTFDGTNIGFRTSGSSGVYIYPTVERVTNTTFYIYTTDNTVSFVAIYK